MNSREISKVNQMTKISLLVTVIIIMSQISVPLPFTPVPINLATLGVILAGCMLGGKNGIVCTIIYTMLGAIGLPVFANFSSGVGIIIGPTGGYIIGYSLMALTVGYLYKTKGINIIISGIIGTAVCYIFGTLWFMYITKTGLISSLMMCVVPFLIGDSLKIIASNYIVKTLEKIIR